MNKPTKTDLKKKALGTVFLVDDEDEVRDLIKVSLETFGYVVVAFACGSDLLAAIEDTRPDLIIVDRLLPDVNGIALGAQLRAHRNGTDVPMVLVTGAGRGKLESDAMEIGFRDLLTKPVMIGDLENCVEKHINR